ncbi:MAG: hypothetical protein ACPGUD_06515 [Parashewanella sp.]
MKTRSFKFIIGWQLMAIICLLLINSFSVFAVELVHQQVFPLQGKHSMEVDWWLPDGTPKALVYLQHRFMGSSENLMALGKDIAEHGFVVLMPTINVAFGNKILAQKVADTLNQQQFLLPHQLAIPDDWVLIGHSAGGLNVLFIADTLAKMGNKQLKEVINLDGVDLNNKMSRLISNINVANYPVNFMLSNPSMCNAHNNAVKAIKNSSFSKGRVVQLTNGSSHLDPEGNDDSRMMQSLCHKPSIENTHWYHQLTLAWISEAIGEQSFPSSDDIIKQIIASENGKELHFEISGTSLQK